MSRPLDLWRFAIVAATLTLAGCCGTTGSDGDPVLSAPARPPGSHPVVQREDTTEPGTDAADDDSAAAAGDDDSAGAGDPAHCGEPPFPLPDDDTVRAQLVGLMFCYQGPELDGLYWTIAEEEIRRFEVTAREACPQTGHVDAAVTLRGEHDTITGHVRLFYGVEGAGWAFQAIRRATAEDFEHKAKGEIPAEVMASRELRAMSCDIVELEGLCWEYNRELIRDQGREPTRQVCKAWSGKLVTEPCPSADRRTICGVENSYVIHYYPRFEEENPFLSYRKHCEVSGGELLSAMPSDS